MKVLAIIGNIAAILFFAAEVIYSSRSVDLDWELFCYFLLLVGVPTLNLFALMGVSTESWLFLWFKRKALEEEIKIRGLEATASALTRRQS